MTSISFKRDFMSQTLVQKNSIWKDEWQVKFMSESSNSKQKISWMKKFVRNLMLQIEHLQLSGGQMV